jgi:nucleoside-diphosphate-sugar epimerase
MRSLVTGGAGFIGSNLVDALIERGDEVAVVDSLVTGRAEHVAAAATLHEVDITDVPALDFVKLTLAGMLTLLVTAGLAGDAHNHDILRLALAGTAGLTVYALACVASRLVGAREWGFITTSTRRLLAARASGATTTSL